MKYLISSKRSRALVAIGIVAISIGLISKKLINYQTGGCVKGTQQLTLSIKPLTFLLVPQFLNPVNFDNSFSESTPKISFPFISHVGKPLIFLSMHNLV